MKKLFNYLIVFGIATVLFGAYVFFLDKINSKSVEAPDGTEVSSTTNSLINVDTPSTIQIKSSSKRYASEHYKFQLDYPDYLAVKEISNGEKTDSKTITFINEEKKAGFQIFIVPYLGPTVTRERFLMDLPSGVYENPKSATLDGVPAQIFESKSKEMGETFEVWFQRGDYLYEVSTFKASKDWLVEIMQSWRFSKELPVSSGLPAQSQ